MTQFRALPVRRGDAYLLRSRRGHYLVDGGEQGCDLPELLEDRKVRKLRAAICTSACRERLGGILELMESEHVLSELWFPEGLEVLIELARRFNGDWDGVLNILNGRSGEGAAVHGGWTVPSFTPRGDRLRRLEGTSVLIGLAMAVCLDSSPDSRFANESGLEGTEQDRLFGLTQFFTRTLEVLTERAAIRWKSNGTSMNRIIRRMGWRLFHGGGPEELAMLCGRLLMAEAELLPGGEERGRQAVTQGLAMAAMAGSLLAKTTAKLRFFRHTGNHEDYLVPRHPIRCVNGIEVSPLDGLAAISTPQAILNAARALSAHRSGLIFQYGDADCCVLFCSDTRMSFLNTSQHLQLDRPTVITAPRQGSYASERTYSRILSANPDQDVWIRTHNPNARKISDYYREKENKVCLNNCQHLTLQEILLEFSGNRWTSLVGEGCACG